MNCQWKLEAYLQRRLTVLKRSAHRWETSLSSQSFLTSKKLALWLSFISASPLPLHQPRLPGCLFHLVIYASRPGTIVAVLWNRDILSSNGPPWRCLPMLQPPLLPLRVWRRHRQPACVSQRARVRDYRCPMLRLVPPISSNLRHSLPVVLIFRDARAVNVSYLSLLLLPPLHFSSVSQHTQSALFHAIQFFDFLVMVSSNAPSLLFLLLCFWWL